jgi:23S rRNA pseudouridine2605 synthase
MEVPVKLRINQFLAKCGLGSRRSVEKFIAEGRISINDSVLHNLAKQVDPEHDRICVDGVPLYIDRELLYYQYYKPVGVVTSFSDPHAEKTLRDELPELPENVNYVGRLDQDSEGLLIFTNDGDLIQQLTHPSKHVPKTYWVQVSKQLSQSALERFRTGIELEEGMTAEAKIKPMDRNSAENWYEVILYQGWKRQIRRMFDVLDTNVIRLIRMRIANISVDRLKPGELRLLSKSQISYLKKIAYRNQTQMDTD